MKSNSNNIILLIFAYIVLIIVATVIAGHVISSGIKPGNGAVIIMKTLLFICNAVSIPIVSCYMWLNRDRILK